MGGDGVKVPTIVYSYGWPKEAFWWVPKKIQTSRITILAGPIHRGWRIGGAIIDVVAFFSLAASSLYGVEHLLNRPRTPPASQNSADLK